MKEYDIYVPLRYNDGSPIEAHKITGIGEQLLKHFGGVTFWPQPGRGLWTKGRVTFRDDIVIFRVLTGEGRFAKRWLRQLKEKLKKDLKQKEILIVGKDAEVL